MSGRQNLYGLAVYGTIALAAVIGAVILGWRGALNSDAVAAILTGALSLAAANAGAQGAIFTAVNGKSLVTPQLIAEQAATNRTALVAAAAAPASTVTPQEPAAQEPEE